MDVKNILIFHEIISSELPSSFLASKTFPLLVCQQGVSKLTTNFTF
jgi:hypothetical protein